MISNYPMTDFGDRRHSGRLLRTVQISLEQPLLGERLFCSGRGPLQLTGILTLSDINRSPETWTGAKSNGCLVRYCRH